MISLGSWWWPKRPARVPRAWAAGLLAGLGAALFGAAALLIKTGAVSWDVRLFRILNQVPAALASVLTPLSHLFLPVGIVAVVVLTVGYVVIRNRGVLPVAAAAVAAGMAWALAHVAKAIADRPRPYEVIADAVLRQRHELSLQPHRRDRGGRDRARAVPAPGACRGGNRVRRPARLVSGVPRRALSTGRPGRSRHWYGGGWCDIADARSPAPPRGTGSEQPERSPGPRPRSPARGPGVNAEPICHLRGRMALTGACLSLSQVV